MTDRDVGMANARRRFEALLADQGEGVCLASLPLLVEEIAAEEAGGDAELEAAIVAQLRGRAGLHT